VLIPSDKLDDQWRSQYSEKEKLIVNRGAKEGKKRRKKEGKNIGDREFEDF